ncbi:MAG: hypothetical protein KKH61_07535 [Gammaproteobacteria bacterium]|nr:hypothetical protein [Gammaproteobacteria bacterium]
MKADGAERGEEFAGRASEMRNSPWLASEDILGLGDVRATIERVWRHRDVTMQDGRKEAVLYALSFAGKDKRMVLNATNRKRLAAAFGADVRKWTGKNILLYVESGVRKPGGAKGETCNGLRLKIPAGPGPRPSELPEPPADLELPRVGQDE